MTPRLPFLAAVTALIVSAALAGCSTGVPAASGGGSSSSIPAASGSPAPAKHSAFTIPTTCLSASEVSNLLGLPEAGPTMTADTDQLICEYLTATQDGAIINYQNKPGASAASLAAEVTSNPPQGATIKPIEHLGDAAYEVDAAGSTGVLLITGSTVIDIAGGGASIDRVEALAVDVLAG
jgi:hypothetical protein